MKAKPKKYSRTSRRASVASLVEHGSRRSAPLRSIERHEARIVEDFDVIALGHLRALGLRGARVAVAGEALRVSVAVDAAARLAEPQKIFWKIHVRTYGGRPPDV